MGHCVLGYFFIERCSLTKRMLFPETGVFSLLEWITANTPQKIRTFHWRVLSRKESLITHRCVFSTLFFTFCCADKTRFLKPWETLVYKFKKDDSNFCFKKTCFDRSSVFYFKGKLKSAFEPISGPSGRNFSQFL